MAWSSPAFDSDDYCGMYRLGWLFESQLSFQSSVLAAMLVPAWLQVILVGFRSDTCSNMHELLAE